MRLPRQEPKRARIEIIPMIDTIFFLLVFFMITSLSMVQMNAHKVNLPQSAIAHDNPRDKVVVTLDASNRYFIDKRQVSFSDILPSLREKVKDTPGITVILNCDRSRTTGAMLRMMDVAEQANPEALEMAASPKPQTADNQSAEPKS